VPRMTLGQASGGRPRPVSNRRSYRQQAGGGGTIRPRGGMPAANVGPGQRVLGGMPGGNMGPPPGIIGNQDALRAQMGGGQPMGGMQGWGLSPQMQQILQARMAGGGPMGMGPPPQQGGFGGFKSPYDQYMAGGQPPPTAQQNNMGMQRLGDFLKGGGDFNRLRSMYDQYGPGSLDRGLPMGGPSQVQAGTGMMGGYGMAGGGTGGGNYGGQFTGYGSRGQMGGGNMGGGYNPPWGSTPESIRNYYQRTPSMNDPSMVAYQGRR
jgi:hypothetical protein